MITSCASSVTGKVASGMTAATITATRQGRINIKLSAVTATALARFMRKMMMKKNKNVELSSGDIWLLLYVLQSFITFAFGEDVDKMKEKANVLQKKLHKQLFPEEGA